MPTFFEKWSLAEAPHSEVEKIRKETGLSTMVSGILCNRIRGGGGSANEWIHPRLENILDPHQLTYCEPAARQLLEAMSKEKNIGIFSDYDVDGISSAALLSRVITGLGGRASTFIPDRIDEGYGLSLAALERNFDKAVPDLLIVLDCGTASDNEIEWVTQKGTQLIIIDHHSRNDQPLLPDNCLLINPHLPDQFQPEFQSHCTAGLVFKFVHALLRAWDHEFGGAREKVNLRELLDLVALGTVADLVPLRGENRIFAHHGLKQFARTNNHGLRALLQVADVDVSSPLKSADIGFRLGPRINAGGRIETGMLALDLLLTNDNRLAFDLARKLDGINQQRRSLEQHVTDEAIKMIDDNPAMGIVVWGKDWHPGVVGIVAGRLARQFHRPAIVLGWDGSCYKGSGRGISGINLLEVVRSCANPPEKWGGHPAAMGLSISEEALPGFCTSFAESVHSLCKGELPAKCLRIDATSKVGDLSRRTVLEMESVGPFGQENPEPVVALSSVCLKEPPRRMGRNHIRFDLPEAPEIQGIGWKMAEQAPPVGRDVDLAVRLSRSWWRGRESLRAEVVDWRLS